MKVENMEKDKNLSPNAVHGTPFGCGVGRLHEVGESGVYVDKGELRSDPTRRVESMKADGKFLALERPREKGKFVSSNNPEYIRLTRVIESGLPYEHLIVGDRDPSTLSPEDLLMQREEYNSNNQQRADYLLGILEVGHRINDLQVSEDVKQMYKIGYALINYFISSVVSDNTNIEALEGEGLDLIVDGIEKTDITGLAAAQILGNMGIVEEVFGSEITGIMMDKIGRTYETIDDLNSAIKREKEMIGKSKEQVTEYQH